MSLPVEVEVEVEGRWDALALSELLTPFRSFLVQRDRERWVVHARVPGPRGESLDEALEAIDEWRLDRSVEEVSYRVEGEPYQLPVGEPVERAALGAHLAGHVR